MDLGRYERDTLFSEISRTDRLPPLATLDLEKSVKDTQDEKSLV